MRSCIKNANVVLSDKILNNASVLVEDGKIISITTEEVLCDNFIDAKGLFLMPGFIDLHCHGGNGLDFMDASVEEMKDLASFHLNHGTTTLYATTLTDTYVSIEASLETYKKLVESGDTLSLEGVHLEGPWLSVKQCGAQEPDRICAIDLDKFNELTKNYPFIKRVSIAPELDDAKEFCLLAKEKDVVVSAGHTDADFDTIIDFKKYGMNLLTHFYSGMRGVVRINAYRVAGAIEAGLYDDDIVVEIIADGKHLPKSLLKLIYKCKGANRICLITDAMRACGFSDGQKSMLGKLVGGTEVIVDDGVAKLPTLDSFAGSVATFDRLIRTMGIDLGFSLVEVAKMASTTPAKVMGLTDRGEIKEGLRADLVLLDDKLQVKGVMLKGNLVKNNI